VLVTVSCVIVSSTRDEKLGRNLNVFCMSLSEFFNHLLVLLDTRKLVRKSIFVETPDVLFADELYKKMSFLMLS
jgi:hypothetical protein